MSTAPMLEVAIHDGPVAVVDLAWPADCGAEALFVGRTRGETNDRLGDLVRLEYEVYEPMASNLLKAMALAAAQRFDGRAVRIVHARGPVAPGQASVVIQVACSHRAEAFAACRHLIERIKHELPVWKRQIWERGQTFVDGCCAAPAGELGQANARTPT
jgi:molybdopterin synthase catalytic subunit